MRRLLPTLILLTALVMAQNSSDPRVKPDWPAQPPPVIAPGASAPDPAVAQGQKKQFPSYQGWSVVVFPFGRLVAARGYPRMLVTLGPRGYVSVDPVNHPEQVDTSQAYVTYFDQPGQVTTVGAGSTGKRVTELHPGWNLLAVPSSTPVAVSSITVTAPGGTTRVPGEAASDSVVPGKAWLYALGRALDARGRRDIDLRQPKSTLVQPGTAAMIFSWQELELNWNLNPPAQPPSIARVTAAGNLVTVQGSGFGQAGQGALTVNGLPIDPDDVLEWKPTQVRFRASQSGNLLVIVDRYPSNRARLQVAAASQPAGGTLTGRVESSDQQPLGGASVQLDSGYQATSRGDGSFSIPNLPAGAHDVFVSRVGYQSGKGQIKLAPGETRNLLVSLSPAGDRPVRAEKKCNFTVRGYAYDLEGEGVDGRHYWVNRIEVWEYGTNRRNWLRTWDSDVGNSYNETTCDGALVGRNYCMRIYWKSARRERSNMWTVELDRADQTFSYDHP